MGNDGDNDCSSIKALLKALHCGDKLRVIVLLSIILNSTRVCLLNWHLPSTAWELKKSLPRTLAPLYPAHPRRCVCVCVCVCWGGGGQWLHMTGALISLVPESTWNRRDSPFAARNPSTDTPHRPPNVTGGKSTQPDQYLNTGRLSHRQFEPPHDKTSKMTCAPSEHSNQPGHPPV